MLFQQLQSRARSGSAAPFVTWYGTDGARAELSVITFATAVAKTAGLLVGELAVLPGERIVLDLPLHWQLSVWLAAADVAGLDAVTGPDPDPADIYVGADPHRCAQDPAPVRILTPVTPFGLPGAAPPADVVDHAREAMGQPDTYSGPVGNGRIRVGSWLDAESLGPACQELAAEIGLRPGGRLAVLPGADPALAAYALPLLAGASVVLCQADRQVLEAEEITAFAPAEPGPKPDRHIR